MKFRSDFVTNSSSSSFTVSIKIVTKADETITLSATAGGEDNEGYLGVDFRYSPQRLAHSSSIDELLRLILDGATVTVWDDESDDEVPSHEAFWECADYDNDEDEDEELLFGPDEIRDAFASKVRAIGSMDSIRSITISGSEDGWSNVDYCQEFTYDYETGAYTGKISGCENANGSGGGLYFDDINECEITEEYDGLWEDEEDEEYEADEE
ncbi:MAG: hypothetical protein PUH70_00220 [Clostridiales bacterium]|nr:hypothetical protein [Clostridiales bacterium]MDY5515694.1 hypothetical protein [Candidatus Ventricola sp.]